MNGPRRAALFGGSFDPPHVGHVALARIALESLALDELRIVTAGDPWQKARTVTAAEHRDAMVRLAMAGLDRVVFDRREIERQGPSYTLDTVTALQQEHPGTIWLLLIGADQYARLHTWKGFDALLQQVELAVAGRPGSPLQADPRVAVRPVHAVPLPPVDVSSTEIRRRVAAGESIAGMVPKQVAGYIAAHHLYQGLAPH